MHFHCLYYYIDFPWQIVHTSQFQWNFFNNQSLSDHIWGINIWRTYEWYEIIINIKITPIKMVHSIHKQYYIAMWHALWKNYPLWILFFKCVKFGYKSMHFENLFKVCNFSVVTLHIYHHNKVMSYRYIFLVDIYLFLDIYHITKLYFAFLTF